MQKALRRIRAIKPWRIGLTVGVLVAVAGGAGLALGAIPDSTGVIHGCYLNKIGTLRVIDPSAGQKCAGVETPIEWNQPGPQGLQGPQGAPGATGPTGPVGPAGPGVSYWFRTGPTGEVIAAGPGTVQVADNNSGYYQVVDKSTFGCAAVGTSNDPNISSGAIGASSVSVVLDSGGLGTGGVFVALWQAHWPITGPMGPLEAANTGTGTPNVTVAIFCP